MSLIIPKQTKETNDTFGKQAFIYRGPELEEVCKRYGRDASICALKVFYGNPLKKGETLADALWGDNHDPENEHAVRRNTKLLEGTKIQNILWFEGISARVYAVLEGEYQGNRVAIQLTEFINGEPAKDIKYVEAEHIRINRLAAIYGFEEVKDILSKNDMIGGKVIDLQQYALSPDFVDKLKEIYFTDGKYGKVYYQNVPELELHGGPRKSIERVDYLRLDLIDFTDKVVWDVGCAGGFFCRWAAKKGAKRVIGFDEAGPAKAAYMMANYLEFFNNDYVVEDLMKEIPLPYPKPDIVFLLSMNYHIPIPMRIMEAQTVIFEDNGKVSRTLENLGEPWTSHFKKIEFMGRAIDHGDKAIYHLTK